MIINTTSGQTVQTSGGMRSATFAIKASEKAFQIISQKMYKDPILAIVRELTCNGWDGQQMNQNKQQPIDVHLPTQLEPWFSIRDYGVGMSDDLIFNVYTTVFDSTKDQSNDQIGAMGLGSKTPFAYNGGQAFIVTSIHQGVKGVYSAFMKNGVPDLICMSEPAPTSEPDGVEVKVPINASDFRKFVDAGNTCLPWFQAPAVKVNVPIGERNKAIIDTPLYQLVEGRPRGFNHSDRIFALMGNILYPVNKQNVDSNNFESLNRCICDNYSNKQSIVLKFAIGDVDISASREELHYDDHTISNINKRMDEVVGHLAQDVQARLDNAKDIKNIQQAFVWAKKNSPADGIFKRLTYNGISFNDYQKQQDRDGRCNVKGMLVMLMGRSEGKVKRDNCLHYNRRELYSHINADNRDGNLRYAFIIDDLKSQGPGVARYFVETQDETKYATLQKYYYFKDAGQLEDMIILERMKKVLHPDEYVILKTSDLKADDYIPPKVKKESKPVRVFQILRGSTGSYSITDTDIEESDLKTAEYYYVPYFNNYVEDGNGNPIVKNSWNTNVTDGEQIAGLIATSLDPNMPLYAIRRPLQARVDTNPNAVNILKPDVVEKLSSKFDYVSHAISKEDDLQYSILANPEFSKQIGLKVKPTDQTFNKNCLVTLGKLCPAIQERYDRTVDKLKKQQAKLTKDQPLFGMFDRNTSPIYVNLMFDLLHNVDGKWIPKTQSV